MVDQKIVTIAEVIDKDRGDLPKMPVERCLVLSLALGFDIDLQTLELAQAFANQAPCQYIQYDNRGEYYSYLDSEWGEPDKDGNVDLGVPNMQLAKVVGRPISRQEFESTRDIKGAFIRSW